MAAPGIQFKCTAQPGLALMADCMRWKQVLINLVGNSLKFTQRPGGRVWLDIHKDATSGAVVCSVSDTGSNIPPELRDRLFSKYEQAKDVNNGTGLGLVISQHLVQLMGSTIQVRWQPTAFQPPFRHHSCS
jgi:signal transduction histidine kinase